MIVTSFCNQAKYFSVINVIQNGNSYRNGVKLRDIPRQPNIHGCTSGYLLCCEHLSNKEERQLTITGMIEVIARANFQLRT